MLNYHSGCEAVAFGAWEAGVKNLYSYPGSPVTEVVEAMQRLSEVKSCWATNEKVAMEMAAGSCHSGARTLVVMKHVGLNVAADPFFNLAYTGVVGGLVVVVGDDPGARNSQNEQDTRQLCLAAGVPVLEPASVQEAQALTRLAFLLSEQFDLPVVLRLTSRLCYSKDKLERQDRQQHDQPGSFASPIQKYLLLPAFVPGCHERRNHNLQALAQSQLTDSLCLRTLPDKLQSRYPLGIISSGFPSGVVQELLGQDLPLLQLQLVYPLPQQQIRAFAALCERILVAEESSGYLDQQVRSLGIATLDKPDYDGVGEFSLQTLRSEQAPELDSFIRATQPASIDIRWLDNLPPRLPGFCGGCPHTGIFQILRQRQLYVVGDIGCSTLGSLEPFSALHTNLCMGASLGMLHGYLDGLGAEAAKECVAVLGDSTFFHSGMTGMMALARQQCQGTVIILDNSGSAMTGMQYTSLSLSADKWLGLLQSLGVVHCQVLPALEPAAIERWLDTELTRPALSVLVLKGSCVQELNIKDETPFRYTILKSVCTSCGDCVKETNCQNFEVTALDQDQPHIAISSSCIGCGLCSQLCPEQAIVPLSVSMLVPATGPLAKPLARVAGKLPWAKLIRKLNQQPMLAPWLKKLEHRLRAVLDRRQQKAAAAAKAAAVQFYPVD
jgi:indolepyruvate ferredoxin oxidoreductase alpha subunit